jgi:hypothetical protein
MNGWVDTGRDWLSDWWDDTSGTIHVGDTTIDFGQGVTPVEEGFFEEEEDEFPWLIVGGGLLAALWFISK